MAAFPTPVTLTRRADFLAAARSRRQSRTGFTLQARQRGGAEGDAAAMRVGITCSRKLGNAVARNRAKRRLRAVARLELPRGGRPGWDYVLVGRPDTTATIDFARMRSDLAEALGALHGPGRA